jgi:hypothetical protein
MSRSIAIAAAGVLTALVLALAGPPAQARTYQPTKEQLVFAGDAYDNEMGVVARPRPDGIIAVLIG